jgi:hypothetical protein
MNKRQNSVTITGQGEFDEEESDLVPDGDEVATAIDDRDTIDGRPVGGGEPRPRHVTVVMPTIDEIDAELEGLDRRRRWLMKARRLILDQ